MGRGDGVNPPRRVGNVGLLRWWRVPVGFVVGGLALSLVGCASAGSGGDDEAEGAAVDKASVIVGDSLTVASQPFMPRAFAGFGLPTPRVDASVGRSIPQGVQILEKGCDALPGTVVVALGTNDFRLSAAEVDALVERVVACVGEGRRLVWVNAYLNPEKNAEFAGYRTVNSALSAAAARHSNMRILDWNGFVQSGVVSVARDGVHYGDAAYKLRASVVAEAVVLAQS